MDVKTHRKIEDAFLTSGYVWLGLVALWLAVDTWRGVVGGGVEGVVSTRDFVMETMDLYVLLAVSAFGLYFARKRKRWAILPLGYAMFSVIACFCGLLLVAFWEQNGELLLPFVFVIWGIAFHAVEAWYLLTDRSQRRSTPEKNEASPD